MGVLPPLSAKALQVQGIPPSPREAHSMVALDDHRILVFGGGFNSRFTLPQQFNDLYLLDLRENQWSMVNAGGEIPCPRTGQSLVNIGNGRVLLFAGSSSTEGYKNDVFVLDTREWKWSSVQVTGVPPCPRDKHTACLAGKSDIFIFGGFGPSLGVGEDKEDEGGSGSGGDSMEEGSGESSEEEGEDDEEEPCISFTWFDDLHVLDTETMAWHRKETRGEEKPTPRAAHASFVVDDGRRMIVFGGRDPSGRQSDLYSLDLQTLEWKKETKVTDLAWPAPRSFHTMAALPHNGLAVSFGGLGSEGEFFKGLEVLDTKTMKWLDATHIVGTWPPIRGSSAMVAISQGKEGEPQEEKSILVIFGGSCPQGDDVPMYFNDLHTVEVSSLLQSLSGRC